MSETKNAPEVQRPKVKAEAPKPEIQVPKTTPEEQFVRTSSEAQGVLKDELKKVNELMKEMDQIAKENPLPPREVDTKKIWGK